MDIVKETQDKVTDEHLEQFRRLRDSRIKTPDRRKKEKAIRLEAEEKAIRDGFLEILPSDSTQTINLKKQYNGNQQLINHLDNMIVLDIQRLTTPEKAVADMMEKYQKLNMQLITKIESLNPEEDNIKQKIEEKLAMYT